MSLQISQNLLAKTLQLVPAEMQRETARVSREWHTAVLCATHLSALELLRSVGITIPSGQISQSDWYSWERAVCEVHRRAHILVMLPRHGFSRVPNVPERVYCAMEFALLYPYDDHPACACMSWYVRSARTWGVLPDVDRIKEQENRGAIASKVATVLLDQGLVEQTRPLLSLVDTPKERFNLEMRIVMAKDLAASRAEMMKLWSREENQGLEIELKSVESWVLSLLEGGFVDEVERFLSEPFVDSWTRNSVRKVMIKYYCDQKAFDQAIPLISSMEGKKQACLKMADAMFQAGKSEDARELVGGLITEDRDHLIDEYIKKIELTSVERIEFFARQMEDQKRCNQILFSHLGGVVEARKYLLALKWIRGMVPLDDEQIVSLLAAIAPAAKCGGRPFVDQCLALVDDSLQIISHYKRVEVLVRLIEENTVEYQAEQGNFAPAIEWFNRGNISKYRELFRKLVEIALDRKQYGLARRWLQGIPWGNEYKACLAALWRVELNGLANRFLENAVEDKDKVRIGAIYRLAPNHPELAFTHTLDLPVAKRLIVLRGWPRIGEREAHEIFSHINQLENPAKYLFDHEGAAPRLLKSGLFAYFEKAMTYLTDETERNRYWKEGAMRASKMGRMDKALTYLQNVNADEYDGTYAELIEVYGEERCK